MEPDDRFYRRRAAEELTAASRAVTEAARDRRVKLAQAFLARLNEREASAMLYDWSDTRGQSDAPSGAQASIASSSTALARL